MKPNLLVVDLSLKSGRTKSLCDGIATAAAEALPASALIVNAVRIGDYSIAPFDGRAALEAGPGAKRFLIDVERADAILLIVPCYWGLLSGTSKNVFDVVCGPRYGSEYPTPFANKPIGTICAADTHASATGGAHSMETLVRAVGGIAIAETLQVLNPRNGQVQHTLNDVKRLALLTAKAAAEAFRA